MIKLIPEKFSSIIDNTLNWWEDGKLITGDRRNPEHVRRAKAAESNSLNYPLDYTEENQDRKKNKNWRKELRGTQKEINQLRKNRKRR
jgi:hypothetical protein